jgi:Flp pilus assembly pilin Flp
MPKLATAFLRDDVGATSIEYALVAVAAVVKALGVTVNGFFASVQTGLK